MFITFIYKIGKNQRAYYGKYATDSISDDHEGLDTEIKPLILSGLRKFKNDPDAKIRIRVGILSYSSDNYIPTYSTDSEIKCFDFYCKKYGYDETSFYINGKLVS